MSVEVEFDLQGLDEFAEAIGRFDAAMKERIRAWLYDWAQRVSAEAQRSAPVRTGYLKSTIYATVNEWVAEIGAGASYAYFVEFGTRFMRAQPYLYPAIQEFLPELEMNLIGALEQAKAEAAL